METQVQQLPGLDWAEVFGEGGSHFADITHHYDYDQMHAACCWPSFDMVLRCEKRITSFAMPFYTKIDHLPRQARDKHREKHSKQEGSDATAIQDGQLLHYCIGAKTHYLFPQVSILERPICQDRLGTNIRKHSKKTRFCFCFCFCFCFQGRPGRCDVSIRSDATCRPPLHGRVAQRRDVRHVVPTPYHIWCLKTKLG